MSKRISAKSSAGGSSSNSTSTHYEQQSTEFETKLTEGSFRSDFEAISALRELYRNALSISRVDNIWADIRQLYPTREYSHNQRYQIALMTMDQAVVEAQHASVSKSSDDGSQYQTFLLLLEGTLSVSTLQDIWDSIDQEITGSERVDVAIMYALETKGQLDFPDDLESYTVEKQALDDFGYESLKKSKSKRKVDHRSVKEVATDMMCELFPKQDISRTKIIEILETCDYDVEIAAERICEDIHLRNGLVRRNISYKAVASVPSPSPSSRISSSNPFSAFVVPAPTKEEINAKQRLKPYNSIIELDGDDNDPLPLPKLVWRKPANYYEFSEHFLKVAQGKNPHLRIILNTQDELEFSGLYHKPDIKKDEDGNEYEHIAIDLHQLIVQRAIELVHSMITYVRQDKKRDTRRAPKKWMLKIVVGKGIHSPGRIPKLKPAIQRYFKEIGELNCLVFEGEVLVYI